MGSLLAFPCDDAASHSERRSRLHGFCGRSLFAEINDHGRIRRGELARGSQRETVLSSPAEQIQNEDFVEAAIQGAAYRWRKRMTIDRRKFLTITGSSVAASIL